MLPKQYNILGLRMKCINKRNAIGRLIVCTRRATVVFRFLSNSRILVVQPKEEHTLQYIIRHNNNNIISTFKPSPVLQSLDPRVVYNVRTRGFLLSPSLVSGICSAASPTTRPSSCIYRARV